MNHITLFCISEWQCDVFALLQVCALYTEELYSCCWFNKCLSWVCWEAHCGDTPTGRRVCLTEPHWHEAGGEKKDTDCSPETWFPGPSPGTRQLWDLCWIVKQFEVVIPFFNMWKLVKTTFKISSLISSNNNVSNIDVYWVLTSCQPLLFVLFA